jgi:ubiquitin carboxyl-terminal hydrolase 48
MYNSGPFIGLVKRPREDGGGYDADTPVCFDCRVKRKSEWETADILIHLCGPEGQASTQPKAAPVYTYVSGARQSKRLRQIKDHGERRRITVAKSTTVRDIKVMANEEFSIPTICQRLFYKGQELEDNSATVAGLQFLADDVLDLREAEEVLDINSDSDERPAIKRRREEGPAFGGTLLGNSDSAWSSSPEDTPGPPYADVQEKACLACTFSNSVKALSCEICDTIFV